MNAKVVNNSKEQWMVIKTNPRAEKKVNERLIKAGFTTFLPLITHVKQWSDRKKKVVLPLIPSTLFVYTTSDLLNNVYAVNGVHSVLKFLGKPAVVQKFEIENIKILLNQKEESEIEIIQRYKKGELVKVVKGPFEGLVANVVESNSNFRLVVEIESVDSGFAVNVPKSFVEKYGQSND